MDDAPQPFDPCVVCPVTGQPLFRDDGTLKTADGTKSYVDDDGFYRLFVSEEGSDATTGEVLDFYTETPFPNYNDFDDVATFVQRAERSVFAKMLRKEVPMNARVLEVGCGTGQMSNYLAATTPSHVYAADLTPASLRLGIDFARGNGIEGITFMQMNLFRPCIKPESMGCAPTCAVSSTKPSASGPWFSIRICATTSRRKNAGHGFATSTCIRPSASIPCRSCLPGSRRRAFPSYPPFPRSPAA
jgi:hypothetical protein